MGYVFVAQMLWTCRSGSLIQTVASGGWLWLELSAVCWEHLGVPEVELGEGEDWEEEGPQWLQCPQDTHTLPPPKAAISPGELVSVTWRSSGISGAL